MSDYKIQVEDFIVKPLTDLRIHRRVDQRNEAVVISFFFMKLDVQQLHFFDWIHSNRTYPTVVAKRKRSNYVYND